MKILSVRCATSMVLLLSVCGLLVGCGGGDSALTNKDPGLNDVNVVLAFGDSITQGSECSCVPYPARLSGLIGKIVVNAGVGGSRVQSGVGRTQQVINRNHPAFMLILYGVNDVIHGQNVGNILSSLDQIVLICKQNNVVPVLATYPIPIAGHRLFAFNTIHLNAGIRDIAKTEGIKCVDLEREFSLDSDPANPDWVVPDPSLYEPDGLHPNDMGTQVMAMAFADLF